MAWIEIIEAEDATGELKAIYAEIIRSRGKLSNILTVHSLNPPSLQTHMDLYLKIMFGRSGVKRAERELIATVVSSLNNCPYCINHHAEALNFYWKDRNRIEQVIEDHTQANLTNRETVMLQYAAKLTLSPGDAKASDVDLLRNAGLKDRDILDINLVVSYFNFVNRIALGLGVEFSASEVEGYQY